MAERAPPRVAWVDYAKGICIILVVLMHSTLGVELALGETGHLNSFIAWAKPFRMPDFFLISGLFLSRRMTAPWRSYLDSKVLHFAYFYLLWMLAQFLTKGFGFWQQGGIPGLTREFLLAFVEPYGTLWFIYLLPIFFVVVRLLQPVPPLLVFAGAALLQMAHIETGWIVIDEFCARLVFFYAGSWLAPHVFHFAAVMARLKLPELVLLLLTWSSVHTAIFMAGYAATPGLALVLGFAGTAAVIAFGVLLSRFPMANAIRYLGEHSLVVYLAFFLFMAASRTLLLRAAPQLGSDITSLCVTLAGIAGPVLLFRLTRGTRLAFLFRRPTWARLGPKLETPPKVWHTAGHDPLLKRPQAR